MSERLCKFLSRAGVASRRKSEEIIASGRVSINGLPITDPARPVMPEHDIVTIDGSRITPVRSLLYVALYKPVGYMSDLADPRGRKIARDLIDTDDFLFPVGRLDYNSEGLLLFTNDGELANLLMHPRYEIEKEYLAKLRGRLSEDEKITLLRGVPVDSEIYRVKTVKFVRATGENSWYSFVVTEGKNRMIRKLANAIHHPVIKLKRLRIDGITLDRLRPGEYRNIEPSKIRELTTLTGESRHRP